MAALRQNAIKKSGTMTVVESVVKKPLARPVKCSIPVARGSDATGIEIKLSMQNIHDKSVSCANFIKTAKATGLENIGAERTLSGLLGSVPVNSPTRITPENNGKIRPQPDRENAFVKASGGGGGIRTHGGLSPTSVFKTGALNRSATPPLQAGLTGDRRF